MTCPRCGLPDSYHGQGDGIGSCNCSRCVCCAAAPDDCECSRDWDGDADEHAPFDPWCNDRACHWRQARANRREAAAKEHR